MRLAPAAVIERIPAVLLSIVNRDFAVNLVEPERTPYDLQWQMFGIHVRVHPFFWLVSAFLGWGALNEGFIYLFLWVACVFVSILIHELGHVVAGNWFGSRGHVVLYSFGGLAIGSSNLRNRWQRVGVYFAGPLAQLLILCPVVVLMLSSSPGPRYRGMAPNPMQEVLADLFWINLFWPILNLLPIWPLDGGKISRELFDWFSPNEGIRRSLILSAVVAGLLAVYELASVAGQSPLPFGGSLYMAIFFALFAVTSIQLLQQYPRSRW